MNGKPTGILVALAGAGAGVAAFTVPVPMLEMLLASSGVSEWIPAAAPPLGMTARLLVAGSAAVFAAGVVATLGARSSRVDEAKSEKRGLSMASAFSRLTAFARRGDSGAESRESDRNAPVARRADAHPDAPARSPIFASRDLAQAPSVDVEPSTSIMHGEDDVMPDGVVVDAEGLDMPRTPEPMPWEAIKAEMERIGATMGAGTPRAEPRDGTEVGDRLPTISELAERLERGIARQRAAAQQNAVPFDSATLRTIADQVSGSISAPAPVIPDLEAAAPVVQDNDLQAALATLRGITAKAG
ncbi:hypothetical protein [Sphingobium subterraneum]|uniref:Uncharacterized protein n=1 Tax=Sphingobium subterraneum TaxID=627688 RepID=A0A841J527_9SPHN|nr:hypothetical protein [Sphingobium subterraneum]MBB6123331.1 hypothetical protein [Sphingobium subterraneum]